MSRLRADNYTDQAGTGPPNFPNGINLSGSLDLTSLNSAGIVTGSSFNSSGIITGSSFRGDGSLLTGVITSTDFISGIAATFTGDVSIGGALTYEDVSNVDAVGVVTAQVGVRILTGGVTVNAGVSTFAADISIADKIIHTGDTNTAIRFPAVDTFTVETAGTERVRVDSSGQSIFLKRNNNADDLLFGYGTASGIYAGIGGFNNFNTNQLCDLTFFTNNDTGACAPTEKLRITSAGNVRVPDNGKFTCGAGDDLKIYHNGSVNYLAGDEIRVVNNAVSESMAKFISNGAVELYYDDSSKFQTTSAGVTVAGTVSDSKGELRSIPQNSQASTYTLVAADAGKHILAQNTITIPNSVLSGGDAVTILNHTSGDITLSSSLTTLYMSSDGSTTSTRTLATRGMATLLFVSGTSAYISGTGLS